MRLSLRGLPSGIWVLGFGSLFMDMSSELVHSLLPVFLTSVLGAGMVTIGIIEGVAETTAAISKVFSGALSDFLGRRKFLLVLGYGLAAVTKPVFPLATSAGWVFLARFVDRIAKGIRGALRDALVADTAPELLRGTAFGIFNLVSGVALLLASVIAGTLWQSVGVAATFVAGAGFATAAAIGILVYRVKPRSA